MSDIKAQLAEWIEHISRIERNLSDLNQDEGVKRIRNRMGGQEPPTGKTLALASSVVSGLRVMWDRYSQLVKVVADAQEISKRRFSLTVEEDVHALLDGESILVAKDDVPVAQRSLLAGTQLESRITPAAALTEMKQSFDGVCNAVRKVEQADLDVRQRLSELSARESESARWLAKLGQAELPSVVEAYRKAVLSDPVDAGASLAEVERQLAQRMLAAKELQLQRQQAEAAIGDAEALLATLAGMQADALTHGGLSMVAGTQLQNDFAGSQSWLGVLKKHFVEHRYQAVSVGVMRLQSQLRAQIDSRQTGLASASAAAAGSAVVPTFNVQRQQR